MCLSLFQIQNLCQFWSKSEFSFFFPIVPLSCWHHFKAKLGMYFSLLFFWIFQWCVAALHGVFVHATKKNVSWSGSISNQSWFSRNAPLFCYGGVVWMSASFLPTLLTAPRWAQWDTQIGVSVVYTFTRSENEKFPSEVPYLLAFPDVQFWNWLTLRL